MNSVSWGCRRQQGLLDASATSRTSTYPQSCPTNCSGGPATPRCSRSGLRSTPSSSAGKWSRCRWSECSDGRSPPRSACSGRTSQQASAGGFVAGNVLGGELALAEDKAKRRVRAGGYYTPNAGVGGRGRTRSVPITLISMMRSSGSRPGAGIAARWTTASTSQARLSAGGRVCPLPELHSGLRFGQVVYGRRAAGQPSTAVRPTYPAPPVTTIRISSHHPLRAGPVKAFTSPAIGALN